MFIVAAIYNIICFLYINKCSSFVETKCSQEHSQKKIVNELVEQEAEEPDCCEQTVKVIVALLKYNYALLEIIMYCTQHRVRAIPEAAALPCGPRNCRVFAGGESRSSLSTITKEGVMT